MMKNLDSVRKQQYLVLMVLLGVLFVIVIFLSVMLYGSQANYTKQVDQSYKSPISDNLLKMDPKEIWVEKFSSNQELYQKRLDNMEKMLEALLKFNQAGSSDQSLEKDQIRSDELLVNSSQNQDKAQPLSEDKVSGDLQDIKMSLNLEKDNDFLKSQSSSDQDLLLTTGLSEKQLKAKDNLSGIQKITINLQNLKKPLKTGDNTIPAGTFARAVLLGGIDASTSIQASSDPRPLLIRVVDFGNLPRKFKTDLKGCHVLAACYGDLSSERVYMRLEKLTCTERLTGEVVEMNVSGYIAGEDGRAGLRGIVVDRAGENMRAAMVGGFLSSVGGFLSSSHNPISYSLNSGLMQSNPLTNEQVLKSGISKGASGALEKYADFYIKRAEQLQPVIQVQAGRVVDIVFTQGTNFEDSASRQALIKVNDEKRYSNIDSMATSTEADRGSLQMGGFSDD